MTWGLGAATNLRDALWATYRIWVHGDGPYVILELAVTRPAEDTTGDTRTRRGKAVRIAVNTTTHKTTKVDDIVDDAKKGPIIL